MLNSQTKNLHDLRSLKITREKYEHVKPKRQRRNSASIARGTSASVPESIGSFAERPQTGKDASGGSRESRKGAEAVFDSCGKSARGKTAFGSLAESPREGKRPLAVLRKVREQQETEV